MKTDIEIAQSAKALPIEKIADKIGLPFEYLEYYGKYKAKVDLSFYDDIKENKNGKLILVTALTPTKAGEGKSTTTVGLVDGLASIDKKVMGCLREPSLGPVFGVKGGATGGGFAQVIPMEEINLHFTGDMHAITAANNLVSAIIDNHLYQGNELNINPEQILWKRCMDMNDRALRHIQVSLNDKKAIVRNDSFVITVASPMMAMLCLSKDLEDFKQRVDRTIVAYSYDGKAITIKDLKVTGSVAVLMKDAIKPNLVQTLEGNPVFIHGGPFANIAHGSNSIIATRLALKCADYVVTEAGFGSDLGAQKFMDITCRAGEFKPSAVVIVATIRALKMHGNITYEELKQENVDALKLGLINLKQHIQIIKNYGVPLVVSLNRFVSDTEKEIESVKEFCESENVAFEINESWEKGGKGAANLARKVVEIVENKNEYKPLYDINLSIKDKIYAIATQIYGAKDIIFTDNALAQYEQIEKLGLDKLNVCIAKTQSSLSDDPKLLGFPKGFTLTVKALNISSGADFIVVIAGSIMTMPGLSKDPAAYHIDINQNEIVGLF
ncbi:MAG: formate--tetrahydrofolate ligase [Erysipelotrichaceae bacterium]